MSDSLCSKCLQLMETPLVPFKDPFYISPSHEDTGYLFEDVHFPKGGPLRSYAAARAFYRRHMTVAVVRKDVKIFWHHALDELLISAEAGCRMCKLVVHHLQNQRPDTMPYGPPLSETLTVPVLDIRECDLDDRDPESVTFRLSFRFVHTTKNLRFYDKVDLPGAIIRKREDLLAINHHESTQKSRDVRNIRANTLEKLSSWLRCPEKHASCQALAKENAAFEGILPLRLLYLDDPKPGHITVRLIEVGDASKEHGSPTYATLSHCWGPKKMPKRLEKANYAKFLLGIEIETLPLTFRDAIRNTLALGLRYLWIDALCIVQDDPLDWSNEAPRMAPTFANCKVNLAATSPENPDGGLMLQAYERACCAVSVSWFRAFFSEPVTLWFHYRDSPYASAGAPLKTRAWVVQENLLSPRIIHFCSDQIWWECAERFENEVGSTHLQYYRKNPTSYSIYFEKGDWELLVHVYTQTKLTYPSDRPMAFSGIAEAFARQHGYDPKDYMAGLWRSSLKEQLLWSNRLFARPKSSLSTTGKHVSRAHTAPSWSWVSSEFPVSYIDGWSNIHWNPSWTVLSASVKRLNESPFAQVTEGTIKLRSVLHHFTCKESVDERRAVTILTLGGQCFVDEFGSDLEFSFKFDHLSECKMSDFSFKNCAFLPIKLWYFKGTEVYGLVLSPVEGQKGTYRRSGDMILKFSGDELGEGTMPQLWQQGTPGLDEEYFIRKHINGVYEIDVI